MKRTMLTLLSLWLAFSMNSQTKFNLDFEQLANGAFASLQLSSSSEYEVYPDSANAKSGKYAVAIVHKGAASGFKAVSFVLPDNYAGSQITLSGYIKTEDVSGGYAGLWMRIDPDVAFDNMYEQGVTGTTDWKRYQITLSMNPGKTKQIIVGGLLTGKGKMWLDDLAVTIDGQPISEAKRFVRESLPAEKDHAYDAGSGIEFPKLTGQRITDLELLGRIWGFLKYHHPEVGRGNYNWDYELFRFLPGYMKVKNNKERNRVLLEWIDSYGEVPAAVIPTNTTSEIFQKPDLSWIDTAGLSSELQAKLRYIYSNRHQGEQFYIALAPFVGNPEFTNENDYVAMPYPDDGFRLLSLFRYWNAVRYFFPNTYLTDKDWNSVLAEYIPLFLSARNKLDYELVTLQLIGEACDTHANLWGGGMKIDELRGSRYAPFKVKFVEDKLVVTDYYNPELKEGPEVGDVITHINGRKVEAIVDSLRKYYPASNQAARLRDISGDMLRSADSHLSLRYLSAGITQEKLLTLYDRSDLSMYHWYRANPQESCYRILNGNIGYVTLATIRDSDFQTIKDSLKHTKGIIIDIRNYPSAFAPFTLAPYFLSEPTPFVRFTAGNPNHPGEFVFTPPLMIPSSPEPYRGKLVVIVNEITQSQGEYTAMAFRAAKNVTVVGSTTAGADGNVSRIVLPGGLQTLISGLGVYYPDNGQTQRVGIVPDVWMEPTLEGIRMGRDELLEKAVEIIRTLP